MEEIMRFNMARWRLFLAIVAAGFLFMQTTRADDAQKNLALGKPCTASSQEPNHPPADGNDGKDDTRWCAANGDVPQWWQVDLGAPHDLTGAEIRWEFGNKNYQYVIEGSADLKNWQTLSDQSTTQSTVQTRRTSFMASGIRYVRVRVVAMETKTRTWASFFEFKVFGE
jgi:hypothetical protein